MALNDDEEFELLSLERERAAKPKRRLEDYGPQWGEGIGKLVDKLAYNAGGKVTDMTGSPLAGAATNVATQAVPAVLAGPPAAKLGGPVIESGAKWLMQQALGPKSRELVNGEAAQAIQTMLDNGINATTGGAAKLRLMINDLKAQVGQLISQSPAEVNRGHVYRELATTLDNVAQKGSGYKSDQSAVMKAWDDFKNHPLLDKFAETSDMIPIQAADKMKRATQKSVKDAYGRTTSTPADDAAQMSIATGLRKGMEEAEPAIGPMNAKLSEYINALYLIEPRAAMTANKQLGGLVPLAPSPEAAMIMLADRNPWMKSYIARALNASAELAPSTAARAGVAAAEASNNGSSRP